MCVSSLCTHVSCCVDVRAESLTCSHSITSPFVPLASFWEIIVIFIQYVCTSDHIHYQLVTWRLWYEYEAFIECMCHQDYPDGLVGASAKARDEKSCNMSKSWNPFPGCGHTEVHNQWVNHQSENICVGPSSGLCGDLCNVSIKWNQDFGL